MEMNYLPKQQPDMSLEDPPPRYTPRAAFVRSGMGETERRVFERYSAIQPPHHSEESASIDAEVAVPAAAHHRGPSCLITAPVVKPPAGLPPPALQPPALPPPVPTLDEEPAKRRWRKGRFTVFWLSVAAAASVNLVWLVKR